MAFRPNAPDAMSRDRRQETAASKFKVHKSQLVGTSVGAVAQRLRERFEMHRAISSIPENIGDMSNNMIARKLLEGMCTSGRAFVDVGSHIGSVIDGVSRSSKPSVILAVEAIPSKAENLKRKFPNAVVNSCAVGDRDCDISFFVDTRQSGYSSLHPTRNKQHLVEIDVPMRQLDDLLADYEPDLIKIDVEGAELSALRGARKTLERCKPVVMFESGPNEVGGLTKGEMWQFFDDAGYAILVPNRVAHNDPGLTYDGFLEAHLYPRRTTNYFAIPRSRLTEVRGRARIIQKL